MKIITALTDSANQFHELVLENNEKVKFTLRYYPRVFSWFFDFEYNSLQVNNIKVVQHPNILRQFKNKIPFGLMIYTDNNSPVEPFQITDFKTGRVKIGILNEDEVKQVEDDIFNV